MSGALSDLRKDSEFQSKLYNIKKLLYDICDSVFINKKPFQLQDLRSLKTKLRNLRKAFNEFKGGSGYWGGYRDLSYYSVDVVMITDTIDEAIDRKKKLIPFDDLLSVVRTRLIGLLSMFSLKKLIYYKTRGNPKSLSLEDIID